MKEILIVSGRGQITLPVALRKKTGIKEGTAVIIEDRGSELVLKPAVVLEVEMYSDRQIEEWNREDRLTPSERTALLKKVKRNR